jgi:hypothetical protein
MAADDTLTGSVVSSRYVYIRVLLECQYAKYMTRYDDLESLYITYIFMMDFYCLCMFPSI